MDKIRVLIVDDNDSKVESITKLLQFEKDIAIIARAASGAEAIEMYLAQEPDVVLMDTGLPDMDGFETTRRIVDEDPFAEVIILSVESGSEIYRKTMQAKAAYVWSMPLEAGKIAESIRTSAENRQKVKKQTGRLKPPSDLPLPEPGPQGKLIAVYSGKGGVGCTTLAVNLALALQSEDTPTVLVDADLQFGDVKVLLNLQSRFSIADVTVNAEGMDHDLIDQVLVLYEKGLRVLPAPPSPELGDEVTVDGIRSLLELLREKYAYIVIDADSYLNDVALTTLEDADLILTIVTPDIPAVKNTNLLIETLHKLDIPRERLLVVMNQLDRKDGIRAGKVAEAIKHEVLVEIPFDRTVVKAAVNEGKPLLLNGKSQPLIKSLMQLVGEVKERLVMESEKEGHDA
jgi:pilus assembly protein CpaE